MHYVYVIKLNNGDYYIGQSDDLKRRFSEHKLGQVRATKGYLPCKLHTYVAFSNKTIAIKFEKYLKSGSGIAFKNRHLI